MARNSTESQGTWVPIVGYEGLYEVSSQGDVRSIDRLETTKGNYLKKRRGVSLKPGKVRGYNRVSLCKNGCIKQISVHRLVAEAFIPNPDNKPCINHKNAIKSDNRVENLEWCTHSENTLHAIENGLYIPLPPIKKGDKHKTSTKEKMSVVMMGHTTSKETRSKIAKSLGITIRCIEDDIKFDSLEEAGDYYGISKGTFHRKFHAGKEINGKNFIRV